MSGCKNTVCFINNNLSCNSIWYSSLYGFAAMLPPSSGHSDSSFDIHRNSCTSSQQCTFSIWLPSLTYFYYLPFTYLTTLSFSVFTVQLRVHREWVRVWALSNLFHAHSFEMKYSTSKSNIYAFATKNLNQFICVSCNWIWAFPPPSRTVSDNRVWASIAYEPRLKWHETEVAKLAWFHRALLCCHHTQRRLVKCAHQIVWKSQPFFVRIWMLINAYLSNFEHM